jgi:hypothetical protein
VGLEHDDKFETRVDHGDEPLDDGDEVGSTSMPRAAWTDNKVSIT